MATFIFKLAHDASPDEIKRVHDELSDRFPHHRFDTSGVGLEGVAFDIVAAKSIDPAEIDLVKHAFFSMLDGWG